MSRAFVCLAVLMALACPAARPGPAADAPRPIEGIDTVFIEEIIWTFLGHMASMVVSPSQGGTSHVRRLTYRLFLRQI
jgi:hypothetical protein